MRRLRAATLLLALLLPLAGARASASACCVDDCDLPCCAHDAEHTTVTPVLPCCRTIGLGHASITAPPSILDGDSLQPAAPSVVVAPLVTVTIDIGARPLVARHLRAPPLYHQHCALLL